MKYYVYNNPNRDGAKTTWGNDADGLALQSLMKKKMIRMRDDAENIPTIPVHGDAILGGGHAKCEDGDVIAHPSFTEVTAGSADGSSYWDLVDAHEAAVRLDLAPTET